VALLSRRRVGGASAYEGMARGGRDVEGNCVELDGDAYTVRIVDEEKPPQVP
jgi:hypothetical protein